MIAAISPESVMAYGIIAIRNSKKTIRIEDVSALFDTLHQRGVEEVGRVALRRIPSGFYSEDVEAFFGRLLAGGFADAFSPLAVKEEGMQLCREMVNEEMESHPEAFRKVAEVLGFDPSLVSSPAPR